MSLIKRVDSFDMEMPEHFVRGTRARKSFRIRHRANTKLPPAAIIYMKSLEKTNVEDIKVSVLPTNLHVVVKSESKREPITVQKSTEIIDYDENFGCDESMPLLRRTSSIKKKNRNIFKKSLKKHKKLNKIINFFR